MTLDKNVQFGIVARIKILSNLKVDEHRLPQDGRFKIDTDKNKVSCRVSIIPTIYGEKAVFKDKLKKGIIEEFMAKLDDNVVIVSRSAKRVKNNIAFLIYRIKLDLTFTIVVKFV